MAQNGTVKEQLDAIMKEFMDREDDTIYKCIGQAAKLAKRQVVAGAPGSEYKRGWTVRTTKRNGSITSVVYNKDKPGLTHLLEHSHVIKNQFGTYGRTSPGHGQIEHIGPAEREAEAYLLQQLLQEL